MIFDANIAWLQVLDILDHDFLGVIASLQVNLRKVINHIGVWFRGYAEEIAFFYVGARHVAPCLPHVERTNASAFSKVYWLCVLWKFEPCLLSQFARRSADGMLRAALGWIDKAAGQCELSF